MHAETSPVKPKPRLQRLAEVFMVVALAGMVVAVFVNVVLRYVFNTSIVSYEEISRLLFVWLVAVGSIVAAYECSHLGFDMVTSRVSPPVRRALFWLTQLLVVACMLMLLWGSWAQVQAGLSSYSTVMGYPLALGASATLVLALGMLVVALRDMRRGPYDAARDGSVLEVE
jgi:TRAP-type C4-dicarboxylate transport system permease small subunit